MLEGEYKRAREKYILHLLKFSNSNQILCIYSVCSHMFLPSFACIWYFRPLLCMHARVCESMHEMKKKKKKWEPNKARKWASSKYHRIDDEGIRKENCVHTYIHACIDISIIWVYAWLKRKEKCTSAPSNVYACMHAWMHSSINWEWGNCVYNLFFSFRIIQKFHVLK